MKECRFRHLEVTTNYNGFDKLLMSEVKLLDAGPEGTVVFELLISEAYSNINGTFVLSSCVVAE